MKIFLALLLFLSASLFASRRPEFDAGCSMGYRSDEMLSKFSDLYKEKDKSLNGVALEIYFQIKAKALYMAVRGDFGWYVSGSTNSYPLIGAPGLPSLESAFKQSSGGIFSDGEAALGAVFNVDPLQLQIVPQVGFGVFFNQLKRGINRPATNIAPSGAAISFDLAHARLKRQWWGPLIGGDLVLTPHRAWVFEAGYFYYFPYYSQSASSFSHIAYPDPEYFIRSKIDISKANGNGQCVRGKIKAQVADNWRMNILLSYFSFSAAKDACKEQQFQQVFPISGAFSQTQQGLLESTWHSFAAFLEVEYFF